MCGERDLWLGENAVHKSWLAQNLPGILRGLLMHSHDFSKHLTTNQTVSLNIEDFLCTYQMNLLVTWCSITPTSDLLSPTSASGLPHRHSQNKLISTTKMITLCLHICVLPWLHTAECLAPELGDFTATTGILLSADGTSHLNHTGPAQHHRPEPLHSVWQGESTENNFFLQGFSPSPLPALSGESTSTATGLPWQLLPGEGTFRKEPVHIQTPL